MWWNAAKIIPESFVYKRSCSLLNTLYYKRPEWNLAETVTRVEHLVTSFLFRFNFQCEINDPASKINVKKTSFLSCHLTEGSCHEVGRVYVCSIFLFFVMYETKISGLAPYDFPLPLSLSRRKCSSSDASRKERGGSTRRGILDGSGIYKRREIIGRPVCPPGQNTAL